MLSKSVFILFVVFWGSSVFAQNGSINTIFEIEEVDVVPKLPNTNLEADAAWDKSCFEILVFLYENIKFPQCHEFTGTIEIETSFVITKDGKLEQAQIEKGDARPLEKEVLRVLGKISKIFGESWQSGKVNGEAVNTKIWLTMRFRDSQ